MISSFKLGLFVIFILMTFNFAVAQEPSAQMPQALSILMQLEGHWEGPAKLTMDGKTYQFTYFADFRKTAEGNGLYMDETFSDPTLGTLKGANLIGYNTNDEKIHWFSVDNFGTAHEHLGTWKSPEHFSMEADELQQKKKLVEKIDMTLKGSNSLGLSIVVTLDGKVIQQISADFQRSEMAATSK